MTATPLRRSARSPRLTELAAASASNSHTGGMDVQDGEETGHPEEPLRQQVEDLGVAVTVRIMCGLCQNIAERGLGALGKTAEIEQLGFESQHQIRNPHFLRVLPCIIFGRGTAHHALIRFKIIPDCRRPSEQPAQFDFPS